MEYVEGKTLRQALTDGFLPTYGLNVGDIRDWVGGSAKPRIDSIAVLPLENVSGDSAQEYFADGMTEALIADLSKITLSPEDKARLTAPGRIDAEAYQLYLKGNFQLGKGTEAAFRQALEHSKQAIAIDPAYAPASAGLAVAYIELGSWASSLPPGAVRAGESGRAGSARARSHAGRSPHRARPGQASIRVGLGRSGGCVPARR